MWNTVFHIVVAVVLGAIKPVNPNCKIPVHCRHNIKGLRPEEVLRIVKILCRTLKLDREPKFEEHGDNVGSSQQGPSLTGLETILIWQPPVVKKLVDDLLWDD